jgi:hypothetical protein
LLFVIDSGAATAAAAAAATAGVSH